MVWLTIIEFFCNSQCFPLHSCSYLISRSFPKHYNETNSSGKANRCPRYALIAATLPESFPSATRSSFPDPKLSHFTSLAIVCSETTSNIVRYCEKQSFPQLFSLHETTVDAGWLVVVVHPSHDGKAHNFSTLQRTTELEWMNCSTTKPGMCNSVQ